MEKVIPKIIHFCWFGNQEKPENIRKYINTWREKLPDYEIMEWNEKNFDISFCQYTYDAYQNRKYAFVSDVARLYALYHYGGIYLDTDVEVLKSFDDLLDGKDLIFGFEVENKIATSFISACENNELIYEFLNIYRNLSFFNEDGSFNLTPNVDYLTQLLLKRGLVLNGQFQIISKNIYIYPLAFFSPYDYINCVNDSNSDTYCIHHFAVSWLNKNAIYKRKIKVFLVGFIGRKNLIKLRHLKNKIFRKDII